MPAKTFKASANEFELLFTQEDIDKADVIRTGEGEFNIIRNGRSVNVKLLESDEAGKKLKAEVDGEFYTIVIKDQLDQTLDSMGFNNVAARHVREIKAPMPGLVLEVSVEVGQEVVEGDRILILEAMKMENSICIHANARIKKVLVQKGQPVDKNQVLVELE
ncbi:MAG TPA: biotin/lipoyl-containing protein [Chitinophagaceae bacterium]|nr:biotin/lipoyl-containing protein [Chitinophagaceae bacterium]